MAQRAPHHLFTYAEYVRREQETGAKHEWCAGQLFAMAGGTPEHARLAARMAAALLPLAQAKGCEVFSSDLKVRVLETGLATYPDCTVVCGAPVLDAEDANAVTNPRVVVEVLSPSTESYDRGEKLWHYQQVPSIQAVILVAHDSRRIEVLHRGPDGSWSRVAAEGSGAVAVPALEGSISLEAVYGARSLER
ncbi:MAG: Uma2 family endonuclease [Polyangiaceae bacterium]